MDEAKVEQLKKRLSAAEAVALTCGWGWHDGIEEDERKAHTQLWKRWADLAPKGFTSPRLHPELAGNTVATLARERDDVVRRTLASIRIEQGDAQ